MSKESIKQLIRDIYTLISLLVAFVSAILLWFWNVGPGWKKGYFGTRTLLIVGILYSVVYMIFAKMYKAHKIGAYHLTELAFSQVLAYGIGNMALFVAAFFWFHNFKRIKVSLFILVFLLQIMGISLVIFVMNRLHAKYDEPRRMMIIYGSDQYKLLLRKIKAVSYRYNVLACYDQKEDRAKIRKVLDKCQDVYVCDVDLHFRHELIMYCDVRHIDIHFSMGIEDIIVRSSDVSHYFDTPFLRNKKAEEAWYYPAAKRMTDIILSLIGLLIASPFMLITAIAIKIEDGGSILYKQKRLTVDGKRFYIYKFRSMRENSEKSARLATANDDRITAVGNVIRRFRIDEIPQLFNILKGDMSIVGPRPERPEIAHEYEKELPEFVMRLKVKAGLTGYAQIYGKYNTTPLDKLMLDLIYISQRSVLMDLKIMFYTVKILFMPESTEGVSDKQKTAKPIL
ncbi:MAG: exopolysaccharide biosynthesis polyprenyl glycosylphosphotransferase [Lachnospiraceae bacterium]|nr:exopolysaccharide biosynthesis polyprenyl glycosylphosphotransferase [Lachnospiraceae bacterium]